MTRGPSRRDIANRISDLESDGNGGADGTLDLDTASYDEVRERYQEMLTEPFVNPRRKAQLYMWIVRHRDDPLPADAQDAADAADSGDGEDEGNTTSDTDESDSDGAGPAHDDSSDSEDTDQ